MYVLKLPAHDGDLYYTGRAGSLYLGTEMADAFTYRSESEARIKARRLNVGKVRVKFVVEKMEKQS
jgi:hypothetical protein